MEEPFFPPAPRIPRPQKIPRRPLLPPERHPPVDPAAARTARRNLGRDPAGATHPPNADRQLRNRRGSQRQTDADDRGRRRRNDQGRTADAPGQGGRRRESARYSATSSVGSPSRPGTAREPTRAGTAADAADSTPIVEPAHLETRDRRDAPTARPSAVRRTVGRSRDPCTKRPRDDPVRTRHTESGQSRRPDIHSAGNRGTPARQIAGARRLQCRRHLGPSFGVNARSNQIYPPCN